ncbi:hypothetical protein GWN42_06180 [candidate division KSB1 bacterium]|nr:hypothetical protein [candidate division KSB1 bacterium]
MIYWHDAKKILPKRGEDVLIAFSLFEEMDWHKAQIGSRVDLEQIETELVYFDAWILNDLEWLAMDRVTHWAYMPNLPQVSGVT